VSITLCVSRASPRNLLSHTRKQGAAVADWGFRLTNDEAWRIMGAESRILSLRCAARDFLAVPLLGCLIAGLCVDCRAFADAAVPIQRTPPGSVHDGRHDFDFEVGHWKANVRTLVHRLSHSTDWDEFSGVVVTRSLPLLEGWNESEMQVDSPTSHRHLELLAVRLYNPSTHQWSIYGSGINSGTFDPPLVGNTGAGI
jgi:hypothetical protein